MYKILSIDTSTEACSCALIVNGEVFETYLHVPRQHTQRLLPAIQALLKKYKLTFRDLDAVAVGKGPGSFTGLRIAVGVAQGIAFGANLPLIGISTLKAMAVQIKESLPEYIFSCLDARIGEIYCAFYHQKDGVLIESGQEQLVTPANIAIPDEFLNKRITAVGNGLQFIKEMPSTFQAQLHDIDAQMLPKAGAIASLAYEKFSSGDFDTGNILEPVYLREKVTR